MGNPKEKQTDSRVRYFVDPVRVFRQEAGSGAIESAEALLADDASCCVLRSGSWEKPALVLDFGRELNGGVCLHVNMIAPKGAARVRLRFGESVGEVMGQPNTDHAFHDIVLNLPQLSKQEFGLTGFRFLRLDLAEDDASLEIRQIRAVALERPWTDKGEFDCSDPLLCEIWRVGARTVQLCCQDYILDGIKRDRLVWMGDIHPQVHVIARAFGEMDIVKDSLEYMRDQPTGNGWINGISSYSLWWIISLWDAFLYTGDREYLAGQRDYLGDLVDRLFERVDDTGRERFEGWRFLDWGSEGNEKAVGQGLQALLIWAFRIASLIFSELGDLGRKENCDTLIRKMTKQAEGDGFANKQAATLGVLAGTADAKATNRRCLADRPTDGLSPWFAYYTLNARAMAEDYAGCLDLIRTYWGGMLKLGATSFWEHFDVAWLEEAARIDELTPAGKYDVHTKYGEYCYQGLRHSLCHGWGGGPTAWLSEHVLGIKVVEPGMKKIVIQPNLGDLEWAKGAMPTPFGLVCVSHRREADGTVRTEYELPKEMSLAEV